MGHPKDIEKRAICFIITKSGKKEKPFLPLFVVIFVYFLFYSAVRLLFRNGLIVIRNGDVKSLAQASVVFLHYLGSKPDFHGGNIRAVYQNLISHLARLISDIIVADGQGGNSAALAEAFLACNNRNACGLAYIVDGLCAGGCRIVCGNVHDIAGISR